MFERKVAVKQPAVAHSPEPPAPEPAQISPVRLGLRLALSRKAKATAELEMIAKGAAAYETKRFEVYREVAEAEARLAEAVENQAAFALQSSFGTAGPPPLTTKELREILAERQDNLAIVRATEAKLAAARAEGESHLRTYDRHIREAREQVIASDPSIEKLLARVWDLHAEFIEGQAVLAFLGLSRKLPQSFAYKLPDDSPWKGFYAALLIDENAIAPT